MNDAKNRFQGAETIPIGDAIVMLAITQSRKDIAKKGPWFSRGTIDFHKHRTVGQSRRMWRIVSVKQPQLGQEESKNLKGFSPSGDLVKESKYHSTHESYCHRSGASRYSHEARPMHEKFHARVVNNWERIWREGIKTLLNLQERRNECWTKNPR
ncbi:hypothetical protein V6N12_044064 [Hibiscus sabdariffa]|uniref:Uncharacterized protein n=1 Tax=Hibiscus sabdariffa TaxID=183260 RepID=A0ABR2DH60_9ROSI